jgi:ATP-grasp domain/L-amino acid ligase C-terminal domain 2/ATP-grasp N-terminal domain
MLPAPKRILILATTTGYQTRSFGEAAEELGVELVFATDRCDQLDDPWRDAAIPIRFYDEETSAHTIVAAAARHPIHGILPLGDRPMVIAARVALALGLPGNSIPAAEASRNKLRSRQVFKQHGLPTPWFLPMPIEGPLQSLGDGIPFPCVVKPLGLSGSRGVMRANNSRELWGAVTRLRALLRQNDVRVMRDGLNNGLLIEAFIPGHEYALEGVLERGSLRTLALFDKPDPLDGPFFEETIYLTPPKLDEAGSEAIKQAVARGVRAIGLQHGPIHAECRVNNEGVVIVLEIAGRPIGGLCARALRFVDSSGRPCSHEALLLRHALGERLDSYDREPLASGVMMIPIPARGVYRGVEGLDEARALPGIEDIRITAKLDQIIVPIPEGSSYLGFVFARAATGALVDEALRAAHARLRFRIERELTMAGHGHDS